MLYVEFIFEIRPTSKRDKYHRELKKSRNQITEKLTYKALHLSC